MIGELKTTTFRLIWLLELELINIMGDINCYKFIIDNIKKGKYSQGGFSTILLLPDMRKSNTANERIVHAVAA